MNGYDIHNELYTGQVGAGLTPTPLSPSRRLWKGILVKALSTNTVSVYVGPSSVSKDSGLELAKGEEVFIAIDDPSKVNAVAPSLLNQKQTVTVTSVIGQTWTLTFAGATTAPIAHAAAAADVENALEALATIGAGNVAVVGNGPYVVEFKGDLAGLACPLLTGRGGSNEVQSVAIDNTTVGGTFTLTDGTTVSGPIAFDAAAADVETALEAVYGVGNVSVTGGAGPANPWLVEFIGDLALTNVDLMVGDATGLTGGAHSAMGVVESVPHVVASGEVQSVAIDNTTVGGTFTLTDGTTTTAAIAFNASAADVETALEAVYGAGNVSVTGGPGPAAAWLVEFIGTLAGVEVPEMTGDATGLLGGAHSAMGVVESVSHVVAAGEVQSVAIDNTTIGGVFTLSDGTTTTAPIPFNASAADVETALEAVYGAGNVSVTGGPGPAADWEVEFIGTLAGVEVPEMIGDATNLTGGAHTNIGVTESVAHVVEAGEVQSVAIDGGHTGGTFTLTHGISTTGAIAYNATAVDVQTALNAVLGADTVTVTGGPGPGIPWAVQFTGWPGIEVLEMTGDGTNLTGGANTDVTISETASHVVGANEEQTVELNGTPTSGTFTLTLGGDTTDPIAFNATAADVATALNAALGAGSVSVTGGPGPGSPWIVEFLGSRAQTEVAEMTGDGSLLIGSVDVSETTPHVVGVNEVQEVNLNGTPSGGAFTLTLGAITTDPIAFDATAADVATALNAALGAGSVSVTGGPGPAVPWLVEFTGTYAQTEVDEMAGDALLLVGTVGVVETPHTLVTFAIAETQNPLAASRVAWIAQ